jgi:hypothetical protein
MTEKSETEKIRETFKWQGGKPEIKKKLDSLNVGEDYYDPTTNTRYDCVSKTLSDESIAIARSLPIGII